GAGGLFRTDPGAALGDVAVPDAMQLLELPGPLFDVERMHLQRRGVGEEARADERRGRLVLADHVADVLAEEALDALAELLHALDIPLRHPPGAVGSVGGAGAELLDLFLHLEVPGDV